MRHMAHLRGIVTIIMIMLFCKLNYLISFYHVTTVTYSAVFIIVHASAG